MSTANHDLPWTVQFRRPSSDRLDGKLLARMIRDGVSELFGDYGAGMIAGSLQGKALSCFNRVHAGKTDVHVTVKYCSPATSTAIIRVARAHYRMVWAALSFATKIPKPVDQTCAIQVVRISGTIKKSEEEAIRRGRLTILNAQRLKTRPSMISGDAGHEDEDDLGMANGIEDPDDTGDDEHEGDDG